MTQTDVDACIAEPKRREIERLNVLVKELQLRADEAKRQLTFAKLDECPVLEGHVFTRTVNVYRGEPRIETLKVLVRNPCSYGDGIRLTCATQNKDGTFGKRRADMFWRSGYGIVTF